MRKVETVQKQEWPINQSATAFNYLGGLRPKLLKVLLCLTNLERRLQNELYGQGVWLQYCLIGGHLNFVGADAKKCKKSNGLHKKLMLLLVWQNPSWQNIVDKNIIEKIIVDKIKVNKIIVDKITVDKLKLGKSRICKKNEICIVVKKLLSCEILSHNCC